MKSAQKYKIDEIICLNDSSDSYTDSLIMSNVVYASNFNSKLITISALRTLQSGAKQAYLNYGGERLIMQTAVAMSVPFGLNCADKFGPPEYSVDVSFRGHEQRPEVKQFMEVVSQIDELMIVEGVKNSKAWFKADLSRDVVKAFYTPCLKYSKDKEGNVLSYPPNIKLKLRRTNEVFDAKFYDVNGTPYNNVPVEQLLAKGVQVTVIMECGGVWFAGSKYGLTWRATQVAVHQLPKKIGDFAFKGLGSAPPPKEEEEEEEEEEKAKPSNEVDDDAAFSRPSAVAAMMPTTVPLVAPAAPTAATAATADEVDDEAGDDVEPVPVPKKMVIKKKVVGLVKK